jgi:hypothetical protein
VQLFTLEEANALLPRVETMLRELRRQREALAEKQHEYADAVQQSSSNGHGMSEKLAAQRTEMQQLVEDINAGIEDINGLGCVVKDVDLGLIDFPGQRDGEVVNLCWQLGEKEIGFWHPLDTGFAHRQPL